MVKLSRDCTLIINSCDAYEDVWPLFFVALSAQWPKCDLNIILITESLTYHYEGLRLNKINILNEENNSRSQWGSRLLTVLQSIKTRYVISLFDDFILEDPVNVEKIKQCISWMDEQSDISVFYFNNIPGVNKATRKFPEFELVGQCNDYRLNSAPALWRRDLLIKYTSEIDSPWAWEVFGSYRTFWSKGLFYCARKDCENVFIYNYTLGGAIRRGKWVKKVAIPMAEKYHVSIDFSKRGFASDQLNEGKYPFVWKVKFIFLGFRMVGLKALIFVFRALHSKIFRRIS